MPWLMRVIAPGFGDDPDKFALAVALARITFPYLLFIALVALAGRGAELGRPVCRRRGDADPVEPVPDRGIADDAAVRLA